jgi:hypothetical protein
MSLVARLKPRACKQCGERFMPDRLGQVIHKECVYPFALRLIEKKQEAKKKAERAEDRVRKEAGKTIPKLKAEARTWFNKFIRLRDREKGCYVCLQPFPVGQLGGDFDAGHVRSTGSADHLRYTEDNCFGECKACNSSWGATQEQKEAGAIRRIGAERWAAVRNDNSTVKWTRDFLRGLIAHYKTKCKELEDRE